MGYDFNVTAGSVQAGLDALRIVEKHSVGLIVHDASHVWAQRIDSWRNLLAGWAKKVDGEVAWPDASDLLTPDTGGAANKP